MSFRLNVEHLELRENPSGPSPVNPDDPNPPPSQPPAQPANPPTGPQTGDPNTPWGV